MDVMARADVGDGFADRMAVFHDRITLADVAQGHLVADRNGVEGGDL